VRHRQWQNADDARQHQTIPVLFIDPKGIRNLRGLQDPKIQLYHLLKSEIEPSLDDANITLDSYILSNTPYNQVDFWGTKDKFDDNHIIFQTDSGYIDSLFKKIMV